MSQENVRLVESVFEMLDSGDIDTATKLLDPAVEWDVSRTDPEGGVYRGVKGFEDLMAQWVGTWDDYSLQVLELIDAGGEGVVAVIHEKGKIKGSDAWAEHTRGVLWTIRDGRISRYTEYQDRDAALEAAGLREQDAHADS